ncbi:phage protein Gp27 family protein [Bartonella apis]|uniref:phage protein Gp27 family protein n=1 Tax=Bartonella apis TaxID=1686310 RepID=UPI00243234BC|nr:phage protein Gp27 family protein [Bartonella apis]
MVAKRQGRGRLSSLDLLPEEAQDDLVWALGELNQRSRTQADILFELNDRLEAKGIEPISRSAFNRRATRLARRTAQLEERRYVYAGIAERLTPEEVSKSDLVLGEFLKVLIDELLDGSELTSKSVMELARAYKETVLAQRHSAAERRKAEEEAKKKINSAISNVEKSLPAQAATVDGQEIIRRIREDIYGIYTK